MLPLKLSGGIIDEELDGVWNSGKSANGALTNAMTRGNEWLHRFERVAK